MNKPQWNFKWNSYILIHENAFENVGFEMVAILPRTHCVKWHHIAHLYAWDVGDISVCFNFVTPVLCAVCDIGAYLNLPLWNPD